MKKHIILSSLSAALMLCSCSGFLDEKPLSNVTDKNYYQTEDDAVGAVNAIYEATGIGSAASWQGTGNGNTTYGGVFYNDYWLLQDLFSDNATHDDFRYANIDNFSVSETDGQVKDLWYNFYRAINTANVAIKRIPDIKMDSGRRNHLVAEASFWRALLYAELVKMWGDVPLRLEPSESVDELFDVVRTDQITVLDQALTDIDFAIANFQEGYRTGYGRADVLIANAVAAKISLIKASRTKNKADYQSVVDYAQEVIKTNKYDLYEDYSDNFIISKKHGIESILSINYETVGLWGSQFNVALLPSEIRENSPGKNEGPTNANSWIVPTSNLYQSFASGDKRRDIAIMSEFTYSNGSTYIFANNAKYPYYYNKYWDRVAEPEGKNSGQNFPYMRYSDLLLMSAEAQNEVNGGPTADAYKYINKVRDRAFNDGGSGAHDIKNKSQAEFRKAILDERRWEFVLEGSRWFDLIRLSTDFVAEVKRVKPSSYVAAKHQLFPIPQYERLLNDKITQNPEY